MYYFVFDEQGVAVERLDRESERLQKCWALVDSNVDIISPSKRILTSARRVIQTTSPKVERWKEWSKQKNAELYIMDLPNVMETAATV